jgi:4-aminobutyrate aminotransferase-like enzyme/Ser/Thr protein kinase RdoA (MazF antagonist)
MSLIGHPRPAFSLDDARQILAARFGLDGVLTPLDSERDQNFLVESSAGRFVFKVVNAAEPDSAMAFQTALLRHVETIAPDLPLPRVVATLDGGDVAAATGPGGERHALRVVSWLPGVPMAQARAAIGTSSDLGRVLGRLSAALVGFGHPGAFRDFDWHIGQTLGSRARLDAIGDPDRRALVAACLDRFAERVLPRLASLRHSVIHNDANDWNVLVDVPSGRVTGLIDLGDAVFAPTVAEAAVACAYAMLGQDDRVATAVALARAYHLTHPITEPEIDLLPDLLAARLCISVSISAMRQSTSSDPYLFVSEAPAWAALEWLSAGGRDALAAGLRRALYVLPPVTSGMAMAWDAPSSSSPLLPPRLGDERLLDARRRLLGKNLSLSYRTPLHIVAGDDVWLITADGRRYLDCYNNVAHIGHCHPRVVAALAAQASRLNTNTRYLHENIVTYAERLQDTLPAGLDTFFFVNSGSEANDLALRLARSATGRHGVVVLDWAYHGHTQALIEVSPYKYKQRGGPGRAPWVTELSLPDPYRAPAEWPLAEHGARFAAEAVGQLARLPADAAPAAFIAETIPSVGGQVFLPEGYLAALHGEIHRLGGLCIADEVQVGFGRVGTSMWAFQGSGVEPDIVTMGKPAGAGHPLGIVATRRAIADAFAAGPEYFNTFGGNPVSCAVGLAVLDVLEEQHLLENAREQGGRLLTRFRALAQRHPCVGDVRGRGLFFGLEIVCDRTSKGHDGARARAIVNRAVELGVLTGTDGPYDNVIKIRPPMTFRDEHADRLVDALDRALAETD